MKVVTYAQNIHDLNLIKQAGVNEVIISNTSLSRRSENTEINELLLLARVFKMKVVIEWDILLTQSDFSQSVESFEKINLELYDSVRVHDAGILEFLLQKSNKKIQFIAETGNHNLVGLKKWVSYIGADRLDRLVLSVELNKDTLKHYKSELKVDIELLSLGPVLLFYSPRKLLTAMDFKNEFNQSKFLKAIGESQESPHKGFPLIENRHGTFMYHIKDLFLLDRISILKDIKIDYLRFDLRSHPDLRYLQSALLLLNQKLDSLAISRLIAEYPRDVFRGYFQINKSDVLFKKLKNSRIQRKDKLYIGEILEIEKGQYMALLIKASYRIQVGVQIKIITPEGKELLCKVHMLKNSRYDDVESRGKGQLALINYLGGVWPRSQVYSLAN